VHFAACATDQRVAALLRECDVHTPLGTAYFSGLTDSFVMQRETLLDRLRDLWQECIEGFLVRRLNALGVDALEDFLTGHVIFMP
jgi:hypothetical protein